MSRGWTWRDKYRWVLASQRWADLRKRLIAERGGKCERCGSGSMLQIHHRTYERLGRESDADLLVLCAGCHKGAHDAQKAERIFRRTHAECGLSGYYDDERPSRKFWGNKKFPPLTKR